MSNAKVWHVAAFTACVMIGMGLSRIATGLIGRTLGAPATGARA